jgi:hypothetical protein
MLIEVTRGPGWRQLRLGPLTLRLVAAKRGPLSRWPS